MSLTKYTKNKSIQHNEKKGNSLPSCNLRGVDTYTGSMQYICSGHPCATSWWRMPWHAYHIPITFIFPSTARNVNMLYAFSIFSQTLNFRGIVGWSYYWLDLFLAEVFLLELLLTGGIIDWSYYWPGVIIAELLLTEVLLPRPRRYWAWPWALGTSAK
jgi:hypothetical protein